MRRATFSLGAILLICAMTRVSETRSVADDKTGAATSTAPVQKTPQPRESGSMAIDQSQLQFPANFETKQSAQDAFSQLPYVTTITRLPPDQNGPLPATTPTSPQYDFTAIFDLPAQIPVPEFGFPRLDNGDSGMRIEREGAIIEEGMLIRAGRDGRYEIRFVVRTPQIPVAMRLQLTVLKTEPVAVGLYDPIPNLPEGLKYDRSPKMRLAKSSRPVGTITLPTFYLRPDPAQRMPRRFETADQRPDADR